MMRYFKNDIFSNPGDPIKVLYSPIVNDDGTIELIESGKENLDDYIQSFKDECDIEVLMRRFAAGELGVFNQRQGSYGDFTKMPATYAEFLQLQIDSENLFNSLPVDIKEKFDNDKNQFFAKAGTEEWFNILNPVVKNDVVESEVKVEE